MENELKIVEQKIEDAHTKLLSINQEQNRCLNLLKADNEKIASLQQIKLDLENHVSGLSKTKEELVKDVSNLRDEIESLKEDITKTRSIFVEESKKLDTVMEKHAETVTSINEMHEKLDVRNEQMTNRENNIKELEKVVSHKHDKIVALINELK